jgi:hypothetical protein
MDGGFYHQLDYELMRRGSSVQSNGVELRVDFKAGSSTSLPLQQQERRDRKEGS